MSTRLLSLLTLLLLAACDSGDDVATEPAERAKHGDLVASVNGVPITEAMLELHIQRRARGRVQYLRPEERETLLLELVEMELIAQDALDRELDAAPRVQAQLENMRRAVLAQSRIEHLHREPMEDEALQAIYGERFADRPLREYRTRQILVETRGEAETIIGRLAEGHDFSELARRYSSGPGAADGGDPGWLAADQLPEPVAERIMSLNPGNYSDSPVETSHGWYVVKLQAVRTARPPEFDAVRGILQAMLMDQRVKTYLQTLRDEGDVVLFRREQ